MASWDSPFGLGKIQHTCVTKRSIFIGFLSQKFHLFQMNSNKQQILVYLSWLYFGYFALLKLWKMDKTNSIKVDTKFSLYFICQTVIKVKEHLVTLWDGLSKYTRQVGWKFIHINFHFIIVILVKIDFKCCFFLFEFIFKFHYVR